MHVIYSSKNNIVLRFDKGDEFSKEFNKFLNESGVGSAYFHGIGGFLEVELAYYDLESKKYITKKLKGPFETSSLIGNVANGEDKTLVHNHVVLGRSDYTALAGHLIEAVIAGTLELHLTILDNGKELERKLDDKDTGLTLLGNNN